MIGKKVGYDDMFDASALNSYSSVIEFTLLDPRATTKDIQDLCNIAYKNKYYGVVVPPCFVSYARAYIDDKLSGALKLITVVGFPLGNGLTKSKVVETKLAIKNGADEIDVMINLSYAKMGDYNALRNEMSKVVRAGKKATIKAIIETAYLSSDEEMQKVVKTLIKSRVDFIKTSTGYAPIGATEEVVEKLASMLDKSGVMLKASGGVRSKAQAENLIRLGASRIGTSRIL